MGWNPSHKMDGDDWNEIHQKGIKPQMRDLLYEAKRVMPLIEKNKALLQVGLGEIVKELPQPKMSEGIKKLVDKMRVE
jgi:hypothetical protein